MQPIERDETYTKWEQDAITMLLLHLSALLICLYLGQLGYVEDTAPVIFVLAVFLTGFFTDGYLWSLLGSLLSVFVVNYFFTEPYSELSFSGPGYPITFVTLFAVGILTGTMTVRSRDQQRLRAENEKERTRGNLLRAVSHDLRTPLTAISGAINTVLEQQETLPQEKQRELLLNAEEEANWLIHMVENMLTITRLNGDGETRLITQPEAVEEIMASAAAKFRRRYPDFSVKVKAPDELLMVPMDATLMEQVLLNLLENAALHGKNATSILLTACRSNNKAEIRVEDNGVGLDSHHMENVFDGIRTRSEQTGSDRRNMGIGLTVCRTIVNAHGGQISAANRPQGGGCFCITLPIEEDESVE